MLGYTQPTHFSLGRTPNLQASELGEYIVDLVFVGQVSPTDKPYKDYNSLC